MKKKILNVINASYYKCTLNENNIQRIFKNLKYKKDQVSGKGLKE